MHDFTPFSGVLQIFCKEKTAQAPGLCGKEEPENYLPAYTLVLVAG